MKKVIGSSSVAVLSFALAFSLATGVSSYSNSTYRNLGSGEIHMVRQTNNGNSNSSGTAKRAHQKNWHQSSLELFSESRPFNKEEAKAHSRMLKRLGTVKKKVFDL
jgi:hypothetical protein